MTLNGIAVEASSNFFNLFSLFNTLRAESHTVEMLDTLPLSLEDSRRVLGLAFKDGSGGGSGSGGEGKKGSGEGDKQQQQPQSSTLRVDMLWDSPACASSEDGPMHPPSTVAAGRGD